jgi:16S rRNA G966 N2-methylase RsmD
MFKYIHRRRLKQRWILEDTYAASVLINPLMNKMKQTVPFSQYSVRPFVLAILCNELQINNRKQYLEFGGGVSTIMLAKFISINQLDSRITTVENDKEWLEFIKAKLKAEGLDDIVTLIHAPLLRYDTPFGSVNWFNQEILEKDLTKNTYDQIFVDGPPGKSGYHRYLAYPFLTKYSLLAERHAFYLDDANRKPELKIISKWEEENQVKFEFVLERLAIHHSGDTLKVKLNA